MTHALSTIPSIGEHPFVAENKRLMQQWATMSIFDACADETVAKKLVLLSLWHTYLFGRFTVPSYLGHQFLALRQMPPISNDHGRVLLNSLRLAEGELATNNIFRRDGEVHAHYFDMREACYEALSIHADVAEFEAAAKTDLARAITSKVWSHEMQRYAEVLERVTRDPLSTFLIVHVSEDIIQRGYQCILKNLPTMARFEKYRLFLLRHIDLDTTEHGPATLQWLLWYIESQNPSRDAIDFAMRNLREFLAARIATYQIDGPEKP